MTCKAVSGSCAGIVLKVRRSEDIKMENARPPMGWNSWDCYGASVNEKTVRRNAEFMARHLKQYGYEYVVVDIQWYEPTASSHEYHPFTELTMDEWSRLMPSENRFPSAAGGKGFAPLAQYVHSLGLKFGIHIMRGIPRQAVHGNTAILGSKSTARQIAKTNSICAWNTDMYGVDPEKEGAREYYESIFRLYAEWGVDFVKCDDICRELPKEESELVLLSEALKSCGRDMVLSLSPGPALPEKAELYSRVSDMWRITDDFWDDWKLLYDMFSRCECWAGCGVKSGWPDADMLPVGAIRLDYGMENRSRFTLDEQMTMMTLWCIFRSPLMIGSDLTMLDDVTYHLLTNEEILMMNKNARGQRQVWRRKTGGSEAVLWTADCTEGGRYTAVFNIGEQECDLCLPFSELGLASPAEGKELWSGKKVSFSDGIYISLKPHSTAVYLLK